MQVLYCCVRVLFCDWLLHYVLDDRWKSGVAIRSHRDSVVAWLQAGKVWRTTLDPHSYNDVRKLCESEASVVRSFHDVILTRHRRLASSVTSSQQRRDVVIECCLLQSACDVLLLLLVVVVVVA